MAANRDHGIAAKWLEWICWRVRGIACEEFLLHFPTASDIDRARPADGRASVELGPRTLRWMLRAIPSSPRILEDTRISLGATEWSLSECLLQRKVRSRLGRRGIRTTAGLSQFTLGALAGVVGWRGLWTLLNGLAEHPRFGAAPEFAEPLVESFTDRGRLWASLNVAGEASIADRRLKLCSRGPSDVPYAVLALRALGYSATSGFPQPNLFAVQEQIDAMRRMSLRQECNSICRLAKRTEVGANANYRRNERMLAYCLGFETGKAEILESAGRRFGVTRERVRQIRKRLTEGRNDPRPLAPVTDKAMRIIAQSCPAAIEIIESKLRDEGIIDGKGTVLTVFEVAEWLGRKQELAGFVIEGGTVYSAEDHSRMASIVRLAKKLVARHGAATVEMVTRRLAETGQGDLAADVQNELEFSSGCRWLGRNREWFWFGLTGRSKIRENALLQRARKALAVSEGLTRQELRAAVLRDHRLPFVPPSLVLQQLSIQAKLARLSSGRLELRSAVDWKAVVKGDERIVVQLLKQAGGVTRRTALQDAALALGVGAPSFWQCIKYRPTTMSARGVVWLVGQHPDLEIHSQRATKWRKTLLDHGWTNTGNIWLAYCVSNAVVETGIVSVPAAKRGLLGTAYNLVDPNREPNGKLSLGKFNAWGLGPFLRRSEVRKGDFLVLEFNLVAREVTVHRGTSSALVASFAQ